MEYYQGFLKLVSAYSDFSGPVPRSQKERFRAVKAEDKFTETFQEMERGSVLQQKLFELTRTFSYVGKVMSYQGPYQTFSPPG